MLTSVIRIPERELEVRKDLRSNRLFTIDPDSANDLDDALSITLNEDGTYDVGVHIADVSHFVKPNTALDRDARKRATSVYLIQRAVPMLPPTLSEQMCSLAPGQDRLAFSVIFTMTKEAKVTKKWFGKTVIKFVLPILLFNVYKYSLNVTCNPDPLPKSLMLLPKT
jgi:protein SSD1